MPNPLASFKIDRAQSELGALLIYYVSSLVLASGVTFVFWYDLSQSSAWLWLVAFIALLSIEVWSISKTPENRLYDRLTNIAIALIWVMPVSLWFATISPESKLLIAVFYVLAALCGVLLKRNGMFRTVLTVGVSLPMILLQLWQLNGLSLSYASISVLVAWLIILALGWLLGWSNAERNRLFSERELLLEKLEAKILELDAARADEKTARGLADAANKDKSKFLAMVSHDLRQPIYAATLMLETTQQGEKSNITHQDLSQIQRSLNDLTDFLEGLLDSAMLDSGELIARPSVFSLQMIAQQLEMDYSDMASQHGLNIVLELPAINVETDPILISRVLRNLISNAIYHSSGTEVRVSSNQEDEKVVIVVDDDGIGLPHQLQSLFCVVSNEDDSTASSPDPKRRGLGLSIVRRLCELLELSVSLVDTQIGTRFEIRGLKLVDTSIDVQPHSQYSPPLGEKTIVLVDDDQVLLDRLTALLARWGYRVHASSGQLLDIPCPDLLIVDLELCLEEDGIDIVERARARWGEELPAFIITGNTSAEVASRVQSAGLRLVTKPIQPAALKSIILTELSL